MFLITYFNRFIFFSFCGWIWESIYCAAKNKHWSNRGFLFGPLCPIYGFGAVGAILLFGELPKYLGISAAQTSSVVSAYSSDNIPLVYVFFISLVGSAILEYITATLLEVFFHAKWWDYSDVPLNIKGRVSLPTACGFGLAGVAIVKWVMPFIMNLQDDAHPTASTLLALTLAVLLGMDFGFTVESLTSIINKMENMQETFDTRMESTVQLAQLGPGAVAVAAGSYAREAALNAAESAVSAAATLKENATEAASTMKESAIEAATAMKENTADRISDMKESTTDKLSAMKENTIGRAVNLKDSTNEKALELKDTASALSDEWINQNMSIYERHHISIIKEYHGRKDTKNDRAARSLQRMKKAMDARKRMK